MGMIKDLWEIGKELFDISDKLKKQSTEKREKLSNLLANVGGVIKDTYEQLSNNVYPGGNCQQLELFSDELFEKTREVLGDLKARNLSDKLKQAHEVERLHSDINSGKVDKKELMLLDETSGYFMASSKLILV